VPARYTANRRLGIWVSAQRQQYKILQHNEQLEQMEGDLPDSAEGDTRVTLGVGDGKGRRSAPLNQERVNLLNALGFTWTIRSRDALGESWNQRFQELRQFKLEHGHCLVPSRYDKNPELGIWVGTQRSQYRLYVRAAETGQVANTNMNDDRVRELEDLGFVWALRGSIAEDAGAAAEAAAAAVEIADQVAVAAAGGASHHQHHSHHQNNQNHHHPHQQSHHHGDDPTLVGHHVVPEILDYHPYPVAMHQHHSQQEHHHDPRNLVDNTIGMDNSVGVPASSSGRNDNDKQHVTNQSNNPRGAGNSSSLSIETAQESFVSVDI
jgi:Helicase associated domain